jgi:asparagine synthetase B (glutamine-hydrolysing)
MFLLLSKENSQKVNKNIMLPTCHEFQQRLVDHFPHLVNCSINIQRMNNTIVYGDYTAKFKPELSNSHTVLKKDNENIILGDFAGEKICFCSSLPASGCTQNENFAQKIGKKFALLQGELFADFDDQFMLACVGGDKNSIHVATNPLSSRSIYWVEDTSGILVSTDLSFIKAMINKDLCLSKRGLASWLSGYPNPEISLFEQVNVLPIGYRLELTADNVAKTIKFWDIDPKEKLTLNSQDEYSAQFLALLNSSVSQTCQSEQAVIVSQMSGGLDSTSITALAHDYLKGVGKKVIPLSHIYTHSEKSDESQLVKDMLDYLNIQTNIQMPVDEGADRDFLALYPTDIESPGTVLSPRYVKELASVKAAGADVLLSGNGGDEMCWGHSSAYTQRLKKGDVKVISEVMQACDDMDLPKRRTLTQLFVKPFIPELLLKMLTLKKSGAIEQGVPIWLSAKAKALAIEETAIANPFDVKVDPVGYNRYQSLKTTSTYNAVHSYQKVAQQFGIDVRHPFFDSNLAKFTFAIPAKQLIQGPYPKWLLRHSMQDYLPKSVCWNLKKTTFDQHFGNLVKENAQEIRLLLEDERLAEMGLINHTLLLREFDQVVSNPTAALNVDMLYAILTFSWLKTHFPK